MQSQSHDHISRARSTELSMPYTQLNGINDCLSKYSDIFEISDILIYVYLAQSVINFDVRHLYPAVMEWVGTFAYDINILVYQFVHHNDPVWQRGLPRCPDARQV